MSSDAHSLGPKSSVLKQKPSPAVSISAQAVLHVAQTDIIDLGMYLKLWSAIGCAALPRKTRKASDDCEMDAGKLFGYEPKAPSKQGVTITNTCARMLGLLMSSRTRPAIALSFQALSREQTSHRKELCGSTYG